MNLIPVPFDNNCVIIMTLIIIITLMQIKYQCLAHFMFLHSIFQMLK